MYTVNNVMKINFNSYNIDDDFFRVRLLLYVGSEVLKYEA